ncbi:hypothetical protein DPMN_087122 [Dreissena polymorpha]|uniref:Uncharacterized protein n=1 Tax=Dreissena polymorpha TaxID=45954 RepID=A0A9D4KTK7_DREPO|nr:hypothetical protein DPMN_087122 [Dreissena polymorpha]
MYHNIHEAAQVEVFKTLTPVSGVATPYPPVDTRNAVPVEEEKEEEEKEEEERKKKKGEEEEEEEKKRYYA